MACIVRLTCRLILQKGIERPKTVKETWANPAGDERPISKTPHIQTWTPQAMLRKHLGWCYQQRVLHSCGLQLKPSPGVWSLPWCFRICALFTSNFVKQLHLHTSPSDASFFKERHQAKHFNSLELYGDRLCGLVVRVPGYRTEMYCVSCVVRTKFLYVM
jgi:hypothetical protein